MLYAYKLKLELNKHDFAARRHKEHLQPAFAGSIWKFPPNLLIGVHYNCAARSWDSLCINISLIVPGNLQNMNMNSLWQRVQSESVTRQKLVTKEFIRVKSFASKQSVDTWEQRAWHNTMPLAGQGWDEEIWWDALQPSVANGQSGIISRVHELHFCRWKLSFKIYWTVVI